jgi:hypothetical protein
MCRVQQPLLRICQGSAACRAVMLRLVEEELTASLLKASQGKLAGQPAATAVNSSATVRVLCSTNRSYHCSGTALPTTDQGMHAPVV